MTKSPPPSPKDMSINAYNKETQHSKQKPQQLNICVQTSEACVLHTRGHMIPRSFNLPVITPFKVDPDLSI